LLSKSLGRKTIGIEIQEEYVKIGLRRLALATEYNGVLLEPIVKTYKTAKKQSENLQQLFIDFSK